MRRNIRVAGADDDQFIDMLRQFWKHLADLDARFAVLAELEGRSHRHTTVLAGNRFAVVLVQRRFRIPGVYMGWRALGKNMDDVLGLGRKMRRFRGERID